MKLRLPFIGEIKTGRDTAVEVPTVTTIETGDSKKLLDVLGGALTFSNNRLSDEKTISGKLLLANKEWVYRNNDVIAQEVSKMELQLFSVGLKDGEIVFNEIQEHPILDLLDRFNTTTTRMDGIYVTQSDKKLTGDAFWLLDKNGKSIENIFILPPDKVELNLGNPTDSTADLVESYTYKDTIDGNKIEETYTRDQIIHFKKPNPRNPFRGLGAVEAMADTIDSDNLTNQMQRSFFEKGAISNFVLTTDSKITEDQLKRIQAEFRGMYAGARNAFKTMVFGNGLKPSPVGFSNKDMQFLDLLEWYRDKIMIGFGNTKASLGIVDDVNRASFDGAYGGWLRSTVKPDMDAIVATINEYLVPMFGKNLILGYKDPVPEDSSDEITTAIALKQAGIIKINEAREVADYDPVDGGDVFAPTGGVSYPGQPEPTVQPAQDPATDPSGDGSNTDNGNNEGKMFRKFKRKSALPPALAHLDVNKILRSQKMFTQQRINREAKEMAKPLIRQMLESKKAVKTESEPLISTQFTNERLNEYYGKQIHIVDVLEDRFEKAVLKLLGKVEDAAVHNLESEIGTLKALRRAMSKNKALFNEEDLKVQAQLDLTPLLMQELILAGEEAYRLIGVEDTYMPYKVADKVKEAVDKFATSMLETDRKVLAGIISDGIEAGQSIPEMSAALREKFGQYSKSQAELITRTETLRVSNLAAEDAFIQSGVVEAKQWLVAPDACPICAPLNGKIVGLGKEFYEADDSGFQDGNPPKHGRCRCVLIPVVIGAKAFKPATISERETLQSTIADLESQIDKRTKAFKDAQQERADDKAYIKALEAQLKKN